MGKERIYFNMNERQKVLEDIEVEDKIWILYLVIIGISFYANELEKQYYIYDDIEAKQKYRAMMIFIFLVVLFVYYYFFQSSYQSVLNLKSWERSDKRFFTEANFLASTLVFIAGFIFLMIAIFDVDLTTEIAFS